MKDDSCVKDEDDSKSIYYLVTDKGLRVLRSWMAKPLEDQFKTAFCR